MQRKPVTCLNGRFVDAARAAVPVTDRGFRFGDGVFETIRLEKSTPYQWDLHLARLMGGLAAMRIAAPAIDWAHYARETIRRNRATEGFLRIAVSRGSGSRGYLPFPEDMPATWVIEYLEPSPAPLAPARLWLSGAPRIPLSSLPVGHKLAVGVSNTLALLEARDHGCDEALQLTLAGELCEAAGANLFWLNHGTLFTPDTATGCLPGTTRDAVLRLSSHPVRRVSAALAELQSAEALFLTNCRVGIWPVASLQPMGWEYDPAHPVLHELTALLERDRAGWNAA